MDGPSSRVTSAGCATSSCTRRPGCSFRRGDVRGGCGRRLRRRLLAETTERSVRARLRRKLDTRLRDRGEHFTWQRFADETLAVPTTDALH